MCVCVQLCKYCLKGRRGACGSYGGDSLHTHTTWSHFLPFTCRVQRSGNSLCFGQLMPPSLVDLPEFSRLHL